MKPLIILGASSFAQEVCSFLLASREFEVAGFLDPDLALHGKRILGVPVLGGDELLPGLIQKGIQNAFVAIAEPASRKKLSEKISSMGYHLVRVIHPTAFLAANVQVGDGSVIYPNVTINTNSILGKGVLINSNVSIGHDGIIEDFVNINPGANLAGKVTVKTLAYLGIGCNILQELTIHSRSILGGGALIREDVPEGATVVGVPAKVIKRAN